MGIPGINYTTKIGGEYNKIWRMMRINEQPDENCSDLLDLSQMLCYYY
tara:strand:+ start:38724 stop:38867 length:144 start_codon:yes stop_codon:yes gene_type:complete